MEADYQGGRHRSGQLIVPQFIVRYCGCYDQTGHRNDYLVYPSILGKHGKSQPGEQAVKSILVGIAATVVFASAAFAQQPKAGQQLQKANESQKAANHTFDGRAAPPPAVRANPAPKPSVVGTPVTSTSRQTGFKPQPPPLKIKEPPPPKR